MLKAILTLALAASAPAAGAPTKRPAGKTFNDVTTPCGCKTVKYDYRVMYERAYEASKAHRARPDLAELLQKHATSPRPGREEVARARVVAFDSRRLFRGAAVSRRGGRELFIRRRRDCGRDVHIPWGRDAAPPPPRRTHSAGTGRDRNAQNDAGRGAGRAPSS